MPLASVQRLCGRHEIAIRSGCVHVPPKETFSPRIDKSARTTIGVWVQSLLLDDKYLDMMLPRPRFVMPVGVERTAEIDTLMLPGSSRQVARHVFRKVAVVDPGDLRRCPIGVGSRIRASADLGHSSAHVGQHFGKHLA